MYYCETIALKIYPKKRNLGSRDAQHNGIQYNNKKRHSA